MKKSMLFTTIATVLVVVVALTTATFAWFSASSTATVTGSNFTAQSFDSSFAFYLWDQSLDETGTAAFRKEAQMTIDFTEADGTNFGTWKDVNEAMMPVEKLSASAINALPAQTFYKANSEDGNLLKGFNSNMQASNAYFQLANAKGSNIDMKITVKVTPATTDPKDMDMASAVRFVIIANPTGDTANTSNAFVVGTQYNYGLKGQKYTSESEAMTGQGSGGTAITTPSGLTTTDFVWKTSYNTVADNDYNASYTTKFVTPGTSSVEGENPKAIEYVFESTGGFSQTLAANKSYDIQLYLWFDGEASTNVMANGAINFELIFEDVSVE